MNTKQGKEHMQSLYLKEFFGHYFDRKCMLETISTFQNGLKVLQIIIENFQKGHSIKPSRRGDKNNHANGSFSNDIEKEGNQVNQILQNLYNRLQNIFELWDSRVQKEPQQRQLDFKEHSVLNEDDDELYVMLNKYKKDFNREKEQKIKIEKENRDLNCEIDRIEEEKREIKEHLKNCSYTIESVKKQNSIFQSQIGNLKEELELAQKDAVEMRQRLEEYVEVESQLSEVKQEYEILSLKYDQSQQNFKLQKQKFKALDGIIQLKIQKNSAKLEEMISKKLSSEAIYKRPTCKVFKDFISSLNKQNSSSQRNS